MRAKSWVILSGVSLLAFGSAMALAQSVQPNEASEASAAAAVVEAPLAPPSEPSAPQADPSAPVEDAPVDVPSEGQSDWAPDINLDAQGQADAFNAAPKRQNSKPRKVLSDAGENIVGSNSWRQANESATAQAQLLARANRRERAIDPIKRSELTRLSRVMGALHALRVSCKGRDDQTYRSRMATLLDLEAPGNGELRDPLVDAFNGGFQAYGRGANACPSDERAQEANLAKEGYGLAKTLSARYRLTPKAIAALPPASAPRQNAVLPIAQPKPTAPQPSRPTWTTSTPN